MDIRECKLDTFYVIGKEGSTLENKEIVPQLWQQANANFSQVAHLALTDEQGEPVGFWGAMTDVSRNFLPWEENFSKGLYLAGVQVKPEASAPCGWVKWEIPAFRCLYVECFGPDTFPGMITYMKENNISLAGAAQDFTCPTTGKNYMFFPIERL